MAPKRKQDSACSSVAVLAEEPQPKARVVDLFGRPAPKIVKAKAKAQVAELPVATPTPPVEAKVKAQASELPVATPAPPVEAKEKKKEKKVKKKAERTQKPLPVPLIVDTLCAKSGLTHNQCRSFLEALRSVAAEELASGTRALKVPSFVNFKLKVSPAKPATKKKLFGRDEATIPAKKERFHLRCTLTTQLQQEIVTAMGPADTETEPLSTQSAERD